MINTRARDPVQAGNPYINDKRSDRERGQDYPANVFSEINKFARSRRICFDLCLGRRCARGDKCFFKHDVKLLAKEWWFTGDHLDNYGVPERNCWGSERGRKRDRSRSPKRQEERQSASPTNKPKCTAKRTSGQGHPDKYRRGKTSSAEDSSPTSPELSPSEDDARGSVLEEVDGEKSDSSDDVRESFDVHPTRWVANQEKAAEAKEARDRQEEIAQETAEQRVVRLEHEHYAEKQRKLKETNEKSNALPRYTLEDMRAAQMTLGCYEAARTGVLNDVHMTDVQINKAYKQQAQSVHPDKPGGSSDLLIKASAAKDVLLHIFKHGLVIKK